MSWGHFHNGDWLSIVFVISHLDLPRTDELTHWGRDKMAAISQTMFSNAFSWMKMYEFRLTFHWILFLRFQLTIFQHWFRYWLGAVQATSHYLNQRWLVYWRIYQWVTPPQWVNGMIHVCYNAWFLTIQWRLCKYNIPALFWQPKTNSL